MKYFWIVVILALVLSPIIGLKTSPRQKQLAAVRRLAAREGVSVNLARRPDARDDERDLDSTCYRLPWGGRAPHDMRNWVLTHNSQRGMEARWQGWRWFDGPAPGVLEATLGEILEQLPDGVSGVLMDRAGVALHWDERGGEQQVHAIVESPENAASNGTGFIVNLPTRRQIFLDLCR